MTGVLVIDKPKGITSHDVIDKVRRILGIRRIGHCGTLDPLATGVLVLCLAKATRLQSFLSKHEKMYQARIRLGYATDTQDRYGKRIGSEFASNSVVGERVEDELQQFVGEQEQLPPIYSAKKLGGQPLYRRARRGEEVVSQPHPIHIREIRLLPIEGGWLHDNEDGTNDLDIEVTCSAGTYIRTLAHDLGERLGCGGHLRELRRLRSGPFTIDMAIPLPAADREAGADMLRERLIPIERLDLGIPRLHVRSEHEASIHQGRAILVDGQAPGVLCSLVAEDGRLLAVAEAIEGGRRVQPRIVLD